MLVSPRAYDVLFAIAASPAALGVWMMIRQRSSKLRRWGGLVPLALGVAFAGSMSRCAQPVVVASEVDHVVQFVRRIDLGTPAEGTRVVNEALRPVAVMRVMPSLDGRPELWRVDVLPGERRAVKHPIDHLGEDGLQAAMHDRHATHDETWLVVLDDDAGTR